MFRAFCLCLIPLMAPADSRQPSSVDNSGAVEPAEVSANPARPSAAKKKPRASAQRLEVTPEREAAAFEFAEQHHPELMELLLHLKRELPREFGRAIRDLYRTRNRLDGIQQRDADRYQMELQLWQARSRSQLLSARFQIDPSEDLRSKLRATLATEYDLRQRILQRERDRLGQRIQKLDSQLDGLRRNRSQTLERQLSSLTAPRNKAAEAKKQSAKKQPDKKRGVQ